MKILAWCDNPAWKRPPEGGYIRQKVTGFGRAAHEILKTLVVEGGHTVDVLGINYQGWKYDETLNPFKVYPASVLPPMDDPKPLMGFDRLFTFLVHGDYDAVWIQMDPWQCRDFPGNMETVKKRTNKDWLTVYAFPLDNICRQDYLPFISYCDVPVVWTDYTRNELAKVSKPDADRAIKIGLGCDIDNYYPIPDDERKRLKREWMGDIGPLVLCIATHQDRKELAYLIYLFSEYLRDFPDAILYIHTKPKTPLSDLRAQIEHLGLEEKVRFPVPNDYMRVTEAQLNSLYNIADVYAMPTLGEGWGLPVTEAMAAGCPVVVSDNSSLTEIVGSTRGFLVPAGVDATHMIRTDDSGYRPRANGPLFVEAMKHATSARKERPLMIEEARKWCENHTWEKQNRKWLEVFASKKAKPIESGVLKDATAIQGGQRDEHPINHGKSDVRALTAGKREADKKGTS